MAFPPATRKAANRRLRPVCAATPGVEGATHQSSSPSGLYDPSNETPGLMLCKSARPIR